MIKLVKYLLVFLSLVVVLLPFNLVAHNVFIHNLSDFLFLTSRLTGLLAFSLIFIQIVVGSGRFFLNLIFPPDKLLKLHMTTGKIAFCLAILHPLLLLTTYLIQFNWNYVSPYLAGNSFIYFVMGIIALILLCLSVGAALLRFKIGPKWIYIHRLNYVIFWLIFFHGLRLGFDTQSSFVRFVYLLYGIIIALLTLKRIYDRIYRSA